jgi:hypothetical protein
MAEVDKVRVRRVVVAAIYNVIGAGQPPQDETGVESYLQTQIRQVLGGSAPSADREKVAKLIRKRTNEYTAKEFGPKARVAKYEWLTQHEQEPVSTYADKVVEALVPVLG